MSQDTQNIVIRDNAYGAVHFSGCGSSTLDPLVVSGTRSLSTGLAAIYQWLQVQFGKVGQDWQVLSQRHFAAPMCERFFDQFDLLMADGTERTICFDITSFYGLQDLDADLLRYMDN